MAESKFKSIQEDVCYKEPEEIPEPDKVCPTCIPNPNYIAPLDWRRTTEPYLHEGKCLYMVKVDINIDGDIYYAGNVDFPVLKYFLPKKISQSPYNQNTLLKSYIRPAVRKALRYYGKLETDEVVCAIPPRNPGEVCQGIHGVDYEEFISQQTSATDQVTPNYVKTLVFDIPGLNNTGS